MTCDRCGGSVEYLGALPRFGDSADEPIKTENVCFPCMTRMERQILSCIDDPDTLVAMCLKLNDSIDSLYAAFCQRQGISELDGVPTSA